jgi:hypothetical protein
MARFTETTSRERKGKQLGSQSAHHVNALEGFAIPSLRMRQPLQGECCRLRA